MCWVVLLWYCLMHMWFRKIWHDLPEIGNYFLWHCKVIYNYVFEGNVIRTWAIEQHRHFRDIDFNLFKGNRKNIILNRQLPWLRSVLVLACVVNATQASVADDRVTTKVGVTYQLGRFMRGDNSEENNNIKYLSI